MRCTTVFSAVSFCLFIGLSAFSQTNVEFEKANFPGRKEELREAQKRLELGTEFFIQGRREIDDRRKGYLTANKYYPVSVRDYMGAGVPSFKNALAPLNDANRFNPNNAELNYMLGLIWFMTDETSNESLNFLEKSFKLFRLVDSDQAFWLAWAYQLHSRWDDAIKLYTIFKDQIQQRPRTPPAMYEEVKKKISECEHGKEISKIPERVFVDNLGDKINTAMPEYGPAITADEETIYFTSRRANSTGNKKDESDDGFFEDIYSSQKMLGKWQPAKQLSKNVNTDVHDAVAGLSPDGTKLYVYRNVGSDGGDLYESILFGLDWEKPVHMNKNINTRFHESSVSLSFDGRRLFFVSEKESGYGDRDIYYSDIDLNGEWGPAKNIGPEINTKFSEDGVFMHPDGTTLYFSSKGHNSMGGYDIFKTTQVNGKWQTPVNMGFPINGPDDDVFFVVSGSGNRAYFASSKPGGYGGNDIYKITFLGPEKRPLLNSFDQLLAVRENPVSNLKTESAVEASSSKLTILKGVVVDEKSGKSLESTIELVDNDKNQLLATFKSNSTTGKYLVTLPSGRNYGIAVKSEGYLFHSENFNLPEAAAYQEFMLDIGLKKIEVGSTIVLKNIFFDFDKATIRSQSNAELDRLTKLLKENPAVKMEIASHTDNLGSDEYNMKLSDARSHSVVDYLISKGIAATRLVAKGYGETTPIDKNDTEAGRQNNRRTEFKILSK
jgi:outer membrane protein OmpA-like peptidoglycan-associated protein